MLSGLVTRFIPCVVMGYYLMTTTRVSEFVCAMERMHISRKIVIPMSGMFRFFPTVAEESHCINDAMRMRGVGIRSIGDNPTALLDYRMVPLMMSVVKIGAELSASALTRGLGGPEKRTNICRIGFGLWDAVFSLVVLGALAFYIFF
jgi:energy-coupling factor transport system permease protein